MLLSRAPVVVRSVLLARRGITTSPTLRGADKLVSDASTFFSLLRRDAVLAGAIVTLTGVLAYSQYSVSADVAAVS